MALVERKIRLTFVLGEGSFGDSGDNTITVDGLRASAKISKAGGYSMPELSLDVWGLTPTTMRALSTLGLKAVLTRRNTVVVEAGDDASGMAQVFIGTIKDGYADYQSSPDVSFHVEGRSALLDALIPHPDTSVKGPVDFATIASGLANDMQLEFENNGVNKTLPTIHLQGAAREQAMQLCQTAGVECIIDLKKFAVWNPGDFRQANVIPLIDKDHLMQGYPAFSSMGVIVKSLFTPNVQFGGKIIVKSSRPELAPANGEWVVFGLDYQLDAQLPGGEWSMTMQCAKPENVPSIPTAVR